MYIVKNSEVKDITYLIEYFNIDLDYDLDNPTFYYTFKIDEEIVGYSKVKIENNIAKLLDFVLIREYTNQEKLFFLKGTGSKIADLGFLSFRSKTDSTNFYSKTETEIILDELFIGTCNDI